jgi:hypothetical protein
MIPLWTWCTVVVVDGVKRTPTRVPPPQPLPPTHQNLLNLWPPSLHQVQGGEAEVQRGEWTPCSAHSV